MSGDPVRRAVRSLLYLSIATAVAFFAGLELGAELPHAEDGPADSTTGLLDPAHWLSAPADGVGLTLAADRDERGEPALRLDYDFGGHAGWAAARRSLPFELPENYEIRFRARAAGPVNHLEVKLVDESGDNVWWHVLRDLAPSPDWRTYRIPKRSVRFAWGPSNAPLARLAAIELAVTAGEGGRGALLLSGLEIVARPPERPYAGTPRATADVAPFAAAYALDGDLTTGWRAEADAAALTVDFGEARTLGGLTVHWLPGEAPAAWSLELSDDGTEFRPAIALPVSGGARNDLRLPETETRFLRVRGTRARGAAAIGLAELEVRPLEFGATANDFLVALAREAPRGAYPRAFTEGSLWTVIGADSDDEEALLSEDGVLEAGERAFSIEPLLEIDGELGTWNDGTTARSLLDGDLPIPTVSRRFDRGEVAITALATEGFEGKERARAQALYRVAAPADRPLRGRFLLAVRPYQVNPPQQFLNVAGGVSPIAAAACGAAAAGFAVEVDGVARLRAEPPPDACGVAAFAEGTLPELLAGGRAPSAASVVDPQELATAILSWKIDLPAGALREIVLDLPFASRAASEPPRAVSPARFRTALEAERRSWRERLDRVRITAPASADETLRTLRSSLAYILVHRDGAAIQPGSRAYARSWIRDGALTGSALLRMGHASVAADFADWFAGFQFADGKVPCCVDRRGADPVPENDSHGELIHLVRETYRYTRDRAFAARLFPAVRRAVDYLETLRQSRRTAEYRQAEKRIFFGLLPESISHEGYSAKPMHSYWDDTFADLGFADAAELADVLGERELAATWRARGDEFRADFLASIERVRARHQLDTLPASAELGDFDSTSTTVALDPGGLEDALPRSALEATFERFWNEIVARRKGHRDWSGFTPYEIRHIGAFLRLGWRERANELLDYYLSVRRPVEWNQWPEAWDRDPRAMRFLGDLPHGWVASDYIRSALDLFAYERRSDQSLLLAAGIRAGWLADGDRIAVAALQTPWGELDYELRRDGDLVRVRVGALDRFPEGGVALHLPGAAPVALATLPAELDVKVSP